MIYQLRGILVPEHMFIDHINRDKLDNRLENLRLVTSSQNAVNSGLFANNRTGYRGVCKHGRNYRARIRFMDNLICIGTFETPQQAAKAYNAKALELFGEYAYLNAIKEVVQPCLS